MDSDRLILLATLMVVATGAIWGLYWLPVRQLADMTLPGTWGTLAIVTSTTVLLMPFAVSGWRRLVA